MPPVKVRAVAIASERSNAIGALELECTPQGLVIVHLGVGSFSQGYAPGALTSGTKVVVPWSAVAQAHLEGDRLYLALDAAVTPHHRLALVNFSTGEAPDQREAGRQRAILRIAAVGAALVTLLLVALGIPRVAPRAGAAFAIGIGTLAAAGILAIGLMAERRVAGVGLEGDAARETFAVDLSTYLPNLIRAQAPAARPKPLGVPTFQGLLPRTTLAIAITLTACLLGAVLMARAILRRDDAEPRASLRRSEETEEERRRERPRGEDDTRSASAASPPTVTSTTTTTTPPAPAAPVPAAAGGALSLSGNCACKRAESVLWRRPLPRLSVVVIARKLRHDLEQKKHLDVEVAVVNNGDKDLNELSLMLQFFDRDPPPSNKRYSTQNRAVFFEGPLAPGKAIKWSVEARGSEFEIENPIPGDIGPGGDGAATTDQLADLLNANHRPVRLHGAMMLAYLGDKRAKDAALKLREALREEEAPYLERLIQALSDVVTCDFSVKGQGPTRTVDACIFNRSDEPRKDLAFRVRGLESEPGHGDPVGPPPIVVAEQTWPIAREVPAHAGLRLSARLDIEASREHATDPNTKRDPVAFEAAADRADLLR
jgi:hypothetical protein